MDRTKILKQVTRHHCQRLRDRDLFLKDCALLHIAPSLSIMVNQRLPEKPPYISYEEYFKVVGGNFFHDSAGLPYVVIPWNLVCQGLNTGLRKAWRFNFDVDYEHGDSDTSYIVYDMLIAQDIWLNLIRYYRALALTQLDLEFSIALEQSDDDGREEIGLIKQMLRDLPNELNITQYDTPEKLLSFWPTLLLPAPDFVSSVVPDIPNLDGASNV